MSNRDKIEQKVRDLEFQISRLKDNLRNMDNTLGEGEHIDTAFNLVVKEIDETKTELKAELNTVNQKLDTILQHLTGLDKPDK